MDALTEMYRSAYFNSLKQIVIDKANAIIKTNSELEQEYKELIDACTEFRQALGKEEVNANSWAFTMSATVGNYGVDTDGMSVALQELCNADPSTFTYK